MDSVGFWGFLTREGCWLDLGKSDSAEGLVGSSAFWGYEVVHACWHGGFACGLEPL